MKKLKQKHIRFSALQKILIPNISWYRNPEIQKVTHFQLLLHTVYVYTYLRSLENFRSRVAHTQLATHRRTHLRRYLTISAIWHDIKMPQRQSSASNKYNNSSDNCDKPSTAATTLTRIFLKNTKTKQKYVCGFAGSLARQGSPSVVSRKF